MGESGKLRGKVKLKEADMKTKVDQKYLLAFCLWGRVGGFGFRTKLLPLGFKSPLWSHGT
jgi:hypothetical protein